MADMISFTEGLLHAVSVFLSTEPMIYVFTCILVVFIFKIFKMFIQ